MHRNHWIALAGFLLICLLTGVGAGFATQSSVADWYPTLAKPAWTPPGWIFAPVWTVLYIMMAVAAWLVWKNGTDRKPAMTLFSAQLAANFAWSFLFFGARSPLLGMVGILILLLLIAATAFVFWRITRSAGLLFLPYLAWVAFATALNTAIWRLN